MCLLLSGFCRSFFLETEVIKFSGCVWPGTCKGNTDVAILIANVPFYSFATVRVFMCNVQFVCGHLKYTYSQVLYHKRAIAMP